MSRGTNFLIFDSGFAFWCHGRYIYRSSEDPVVSVVSVAVRALELKYVLFDFLGEVRKKRRVVKKKF